MAPILAKLKYTERNHPKEYSGDPCRRRQVLIRIWLDFYKDDMSPWVLSSTKLGIRNLSPHLRNSAILRTTKSIAELRTKKSCGTAIADLQKLPSAIQQLSLVSCQFATF
jgi:hypothetical protein